MAKRLIDADALRDTIEGIDWYHIDRKGHLAHGANSAVHTPFYKAESIYKAIENAPTVDAVEVVHGRWEGVRDGWGRCSICHIMDNIHELATHCRFCGADMRGSLDE